MFFNLVYYFTFVPKIIVGIVLLYIIYKVTLSFYYKYNFVLVLILLSLIALFYYLYIPPEMIDDGKYPKYTLIVNYVTYLPNYLVHEFSHRFFCVFGFDWWTWACGSAVEILFPCLIYLFSLQLRGFSLFTPILFYWIASALYDTGIYASDAVVSKLALTSSNFVSDFKPGEVKGDWYYILKPLGLLDYADKIGLIFEILACIFFAFAIYSIINYFVKLTADPRFENNNI